VDAKLVIAINHSILRNFQEFKTNKNSNSVSFILLVELKCNKDYIYGSN
jgi:hypothetical protein